MPPREQGRRVFWLTLALLVGLGLGLVSPRARAQSFTQNADVGTTGTAGSGTYTSASTSYNVSGAGVAGLGSATTADALHFTYTTLSGDGQVIVRLANFQSTPPATARAGLMIRADLSAGAAHAAVVLGPSSGAAYVRRASAGATSVAVPASSTISVPQWLKLIRTGSDVVGFVSPDGNAWEYVWHDTITLPTTTYVGLVATSGVNASLCAATFDHASLTPGTVTDNSAPGAPPSLTLAGKSDSWAKLSWGPASDDVGVWGYDVYRGATLVGQVPGTQFSFVDGLLSPATAYSYTVKAYDVAAREGPASLTLGVTTSAATLAAPWSHNDVGYVGAGGSATSSGGTTFTLQGAGADIAGTADAFHFAYQTITGDGELVAKVSAVANTDPAAKGAVMLRRSLNPDSAYAMMAMAANRVLTFQDRTSTAAATNVVTASVTPAAFPYWVKIKRVGANLYGYISADGVSWTLVGADTGVNLGSSSVYVGLAVTSRKDPTLAQATFDSVALKTGAIADSQAPAVPGAPVLVGSASDVSVRLSWAGTADNVGVTAYQLLRGGTVIATVPGLGYLDTGLTANTAYSYTLKAVDTAGNVSAAGSALAVTTAPNANPLPAPWAHREVGDVGTLGSAGYTTGTGTFSVQGTGLVVGGAADALHYVYRPLPGDGQIIGRLASFSGGATGAQAGVMIREGGSFAPGERSAFLALGPSAGASQFTTRATAGAASTTVTGTATTLVAPCWFKLTRSGTTVGAYVSPSGNAGSWTSVGSATVSFTSAATVGFGVTAGSKTTLASATFDSLTATTAVLAAPAGLSATTGNAQVALSWGAVTGASSYSVKRASVSGGPYAVVQNGLTGTTFTNTGLSNGTTYFYVVSALSGSDEGPQSTEAAATPQAPPTAPSGLTATAGNAQSTLNWSAVTGASSYTVKRATTSGGPYTTVQSGLTSPTFTNTGLTNGTAYYFVVSATNASGEGPNSAQVAVTPVAPPAAPAGLNAVAGNAQVALSWSAAAGATSYNVSLATTSGGPYTLLQGGLTATTYTKTGLSNGTTYYFVVSATNAGGTSANSTQVSVTPVAPPAAPPGVNASAGNAQVALTWGAVSGASSYTVKRATASGGPYANVKTGLTAATYTDTGLTNGTTYYYVVSALSAGGESANSTAASVTPLAPPAAPAGLTATAGNVQVALSWGSVSGAASYTVKRSTTSGGSYTTVQGGVTATSFTNTGLTNGTTYYFVVSATNAGGTSANSTQVSAKPVAAPTTPTGLSAAAGNTQVTLSWTAVSGASSYTVKRATASGGPYSPLQAGLTAATYTDTGLTNGTAYYYVVNATNAGGTGVDSAQVSAKPMVIQAMVSQGSGHTLRLRVDGTVWASGYNNYGQVGDNTTTTRFASVPVTTLSGIQLVAAGAYHSAALKNDGSVWMWGGNYDGQLGDGTTTRRGIPKKITSLSGIGIISLSGGYDYTLALSGDGTVWSFGSNVYGQLGDGTTTRSSVPIHLTGLQNVVSISAGSSYGLALRSDGQVYAWGQLYGVENRPAPSLVSGLPGIVAVSAGGSHNLVLDQNGRVWSWGYNYQGVLGDGTTDNRAIPGLVPGLSNIVAVHAGGSFSLALRNDGTVFTWGTNFSGVPGSATPPPSTRPTPQTGLPGDVVALASADTSGAALTAGGILWCWGNNEYGTFGNGVNAGSLVPLNADAPVVTSVLQVDAASWQPFSYQITATNSPTGFSVSGLPDGLTLNTTTGQITGTPTSGGTANVVLRAFNAAGTGQGTTLVLSTRAEPNLSYNGTASASSSLGASTTPGAATDGDPTTAWTSATGGTQSLTLDLGQNNRIDAIVLNWGAAAGKDYILDVSPDGSSWTTLKTVVGNTITGQLVYGGLSASGRYVRLSLTAGVSAGGYVLREFQVFGSQPTPTLNLPGMRLHLQADLGVVASAGSVSQWSDQSGLHQDATPERSQPSLVTNALNGQPVVHFSDDNTTYLKLPGSLFDGCTQAEIIAVLRTDHGQTNGGPWCLGNGGDSSPYFNDAANSYYPAYGDNAIYETFGTSTRFGPIIPGVPLDRFNIYDVSASATGSWVARLNEKPIFQTAGNVPYFTATQYYLGRPRDNYRAFRGDMAEVFIFDHPLNDADRLAVERYLAIKYALISAPSAPTNLSALSLSPTQVSLNWQHPPTPDVIKFIVQRAAAGTNNYQVIGQTSGTKAFLDVTAVAGATYTYRVMAAVLTGDKSDSSATIAVTTPSQGALFPTDGLKLWLKADTGVDVGSVATWNDQSGSGNDARQGNTVNQPTLVASTLNGIPVVQFKGNKLQYLNLGSFVSSAGAGEMITAHRVISSAGIYNGFHHFSNQNDARYPEPDGGIQDTFGTTQVFPSVQSSQDLSQFHIYNVLSQSGEWTSRMNAAVLYTSTTNTVGFDANCYLGARSGNGFSGEVAEILVYDRKLTDAERSILENYLTVKYLIPDMDPDRDGLTTRQELALGTDPLKWDTNGDGLSDGQDVSLGYNPTNLDLDGDGLTNAQELILGTDPFKADTDGDGVPDGADYYPLDPAASQTPPVNPNDHTPPQITITYPTVGITPL